MWLNSDLPCNAHEIGSSRGPIPTHFPVAACALRVGPEGALWVHKVLDEGIEPEEIGIFVRSNNELLRARAVVKQAGHTPLELSDRVEDRNGRISIGTMHLAKGLEFKAVVVMACDEL